MLDTQGLLAALDRVPSHHLERMGEGVSQWLNHKGADRSQFDEVRALMPARVESGMRWIEQPPGPPLFLEPNRVSSLAAADEESRELLEACREDVPAQAANPPAGDPPECQVRVDVAGVTRSFAFPRCPSSFYLLYELFDQRIYGSVDPSLHVDVLYDLGANIGGASLYLSTVLGPTSVVAVEPMPGNFAYLQKNVSANQIPARLIRAALWGHSGAGLGKYSPTRHLLASMTATGYPPGAQDVDVPLLDAQEFCAEYADPCSTETYGIKLDVEGSEFHLMRSPDFLKRASWIIGELHIGTAFSREVVSDFLDLLESNFHVESSGYGYNDIMHVCGWQFFARPRRAPEEGAR
jgi:FkbM family methyltransferase